MQKQKKVINKINYNSGQKTPLGTKPNDEMYTSMQDILNELSQWSHKFEGKNIICPCDWDILDDSDKTKDVFSIKIEFNGNKMIGQTNTVKSVSYTLFDFANNKKTNIKVSHKEIDNFLKERVKCNFIRTFVEHASIWKIKSLSASGFNPTTGKGIPFQDVDYSEYDICITNPPFSLYGEFLETLFKARIDFIVLAPFLNRVNPSIGLPLMLRKCYLGYGRDIHPTFINPTEINEYHTKVVACDWITTFDEAQVELNKKRLVNGIKFEIYKDEFPVMKNMTMKDGTHPIRVNKYTAIPDDYYGWIFSSVGALDSISYSEFEWYLTNGAGYYNKENPEFNPFLHKTFDEMVMAQSYINFKEMSQKERRAACKATGETGFHGIVLRRKIK
jgi:hypothetical protein